jgi:hypothetical protein
MIFYFTIWKHSFYDLFISIIVELVMFSLIFNHKCHCSCIGLIMDATFWPCVYFYNTWILYEEVIMAFHERVAILQEEEVVL